MIVSLDFLSPVQKTGDFLFRFFFAAVSLGVWKGCSLFPSALDNTPQGSPRLYFVSVLPLRFPRVGTLVQWLKPPAWKVWDREFVPCSGIQASKKQNVSSTLTRKDSGPVFSYKLRFVGGFRLIEMVSIVGSLRDQDVLVLRPSGLEFRILCLEDSVISPPSGGSLGPVD